MFLWRSRDYETLKCAIFKYPACMCAWRLDGSLSVSERAAAGSGDQSHAAAQSAFINISLANQINPAVMWINGPEHKTRDRLGLRWAQPLQRHALTSHTPSFVSCLCCSVSNYSVCAGGERQVSWVDRNKKYFSELDFRVDLLWIIMPLWLHRIVY